MPYINFTVSMSNACSLKLKKKKNHKETSSKRFLQYNFVTIALFSTTLFSYYWLERYDRNLFSHMFDRVARSTSRLLTLVLS